MTVQAKQDQSMVAWRRLAALGAVGLLVVLAGCSNTEVDDGSTATDASEALTAVGPSGHAMPTENSAASLETASTTADDSTPANNAGSEEDATSNVTATAEEHVPTAPVLPEPALSDEEIQETYGGEGNPEPADSVAGTLCNLNRSHFEEMSARVIVDGDLDDHMLRMATLSLSDDLGVWEGLAWQYPEVRSELDSAREIYSHWEYGIGLMDAGDDAGAREEINVADTIINSLPQGDIVEVGC